LKSAQSSHQAEHIFGQGEKIKRLPGGRMGITTFFLGRGINYPLALDRRLKLKESLTFMLKVILRER